MSDLTPAQQKILEFERAVNARYKREVDAILEKRSRGRNRARLVSNSESAVALPEGSRAIDPFNLIGRVALEKDHPLRELLGNDFYLGSAHIKADGLEVLSWAAPIGALFYYGSDSDHELAASVLGVRSFTAYLNDLIGFDDEIEPGVDTSVFTSANRTLTVPKPPRASSPRPSGRLRNRPTRNLAREAKQRKSKRRKQARAPGNFPRWLRNRVRQAQTQQTRSEASGETPHHGINVDGVAPNLRAENAVKAALEQPKVGRMGSVLSTLQPEQYELITWPSDLPLLVQGQPGTGKTVVAAHRAAFLTSDQRPETDRAKSVLVVGPSDLYSDHILPLLKEIADTPSKIQVLNLPTLYASLAGLRRHRSERPMEFEDASRITGQVAEAFVRAMSEPPTKGKTSAKVQNALASLRAATPEQIPDIELRQYFASLPPWNDVSSISRYRPLLATIAHALGDSHFGSIDHLIVDEAQDVTPIEWQLLLQVVNSGSRLSLFGDMNQRRSDQSFDSWESLIDGIELENSSGQSIAVQNLQSGFRSTRQILRFANQLLPKRQRTEHAIRNGPEPSVIQAAGDKRTELAISEAIKLSQRHKGYVAIITRNPRQCTEALATRGWEQGDAGQAISRRSFRNAESTLLVLTPNQARGLEFDAIVAEEPANFNTNIGRHGVIYTSLTRANNELVVVHTRPLPKELKDAPSTRPGTGQNSIGTLAPGQQTAHQAGHEANLVADSDSNDRQEGTEDAGETEAQIHAAVHLVEEGPGTDERLLGIERLGRLKARSDIVEAAQRSRSAQIRSAAASALAHFTDERSINLIEELAADRNSHVRRAACIALRISPSSNELLTAVATNPGENGHVRIAAADSLARLSTTDEATEAAAHLITALAGQNTIARTHLYNALGQTLCTHAAQFLQLKFATAIQKGDHTEREARALIRATARQDRTPDVQELLRKALSCLPGGRTDSAKALANVPYPEARPDLERCLADRSPRLVAAAVRALCALGLGPSLPIVEPLLSQDNDEAKVIVQALDGTDGFDLLESTARDGVGSLRQAATSRLGQVRDPRAPEILGELIADANPRVRNSAYSALYDLGLLGAENEERWRKDPVPWVAESYDLKLQEQESK